MTVEPSKLRRADPDERRDLLIAATLTCLARVHVKVKLLLGRALVVDIPEEPMQAGQSSIPE